jgi:hypothetical protein
MLNCFLLIIYGLGNMGWSQTDTLIKWAENQRLSYSDFTGTPKSQDTHAVRDTLAVVVCYIKSVVSR